jgi:cytochrome c556
MMLAVCLTVAGCSSRDDTPSTPASQPQAGGAAPAAPAGGAAQAGGGAQAGARAGGAGAQAGAKVSAEQLEAAMKSIAQANGALQKAVKGNMLAEAATSAKQLESSFATVEQFFQQNKATDAVTLAQTARNGARDAAAAASANDQMKAATAAAAVGGTCKQCHSVYREGDQATGFRIKAGIVTP